jgi:hypothetical protein
MIALIILISISIIILVMGLLNIRLPFIGSGHKEQVKIKKLSVPQAPRKKPGISINRNTENERSHIRFIKSHIRHYNLSRSEISIH